MSRLTMCEISCATTACNSSRFSLASKPFVTTIEAVLWSLPQAKAFGESSSIIYMSGIVLKPEAIDIS